MCKLDPNLVSNPSQTLSHEAKSAHDQSEDVDMGHKRSRSDDIDSPIKATGAEMRATTPWQLGGTTFLDSLTPPQQLSILALGMFLFFGAHNVLQEAMMKVEGFTYGVMLGYMEVLGVTVCSYIERTHILRETGRVAPLSAYPLLTLCLLGSSALSNMSLNYINFPTKVVFRSCKLVPTMIIATIINRRVFSSVEYVCALCVCAGLVMFAAADWQLTPSFNPIGLALVSLSVCADAILPNAQERLFKLGSSRLEVTLYTNFFTLVAMTITTYMSGDLLGIVSHAMRDRQLALYMVTYTCIAYVAISTYMNIVKRFGGVAAVLLATARKGMTLILSFLLFPKTFSWYYVAGAVFVLGGLLVASLLKQKNRMSDLEKEQRLKAKEMEMEQLEADIRAMEEDLEMGPNSMIRNGGDSGSYSSSSSTPCENGRQSTSSSSSGTVAVLPPRSA